MKQKFGFLKNFGKLVFSLYASCFVFWDTDITMLSFFHNYFKETYYASDFENEILENYKKIIIAEEQVPTSKSLAC